MITIKRNSHNRERRYEAYRSRNPRYANTPKLAWYLNGDRVGSCIPGPCATLSGQSQTRYALDRRAYLMISGQSSTPLM
ncbi:hypothetical protein SASPL_150226 [Salvia splendens]|uniref:Uncharacterized protein n=1 Tax=Salvia splendens TaxID=180675 RepID=A0A8X8W670_SALSN|nr:hypothetical protein SASPL_150226 [Salvia splendens]